MGLPGDHRREADQILRRVDPEIALLIEKHLESRGVRVLTGTEVCRFVGNEQGLPPP